jgi:hypothetical protein
MKAITPETFAIGDRVSVPCRFGECGEIVEINKKQDNCYGVEFSNLDFVLWYAPSELRKLAAGEKGFSWFRH